MKKLTALQVTLLFILLTICSVSSATVIGFDNVSTGDFFGSAVEDDYEFSLFSGKLFSNDSYGNPGGNIQGRNIQGGGVLTISQINGELFTFNTADVAQFNINTNASIAFEGFLNGSSVGLDSFLASTSVGNWTSYNSNILDGVLLDELHVILDASTSSSSQWWEGVDNVVLTAKEIPEPAVLWLFGVVLASFLGLRVRRAA